MVERALFLTEHNEAITSQATAESSVQIGERLPVGLWQLAGWDDFDVAAMPALAALGLENPGIFGTLQHGKKAKGFLIAPDRLWVETTNDLSHFFSESLTVLDLTHSRTIITIHGSHARDVLAQIAAIDFSAVAFPEGSFRQTGIHGVGVLILCCGEDEFEIYVPVTWARTTWEYLATCAAPWRADIEQTKEALKRHTTSTIRAQPPEKETS